MAILCEHSFTADIGEPLTRFLRSASTLSSYLNVIQRALAFISLHPSRTPSFVAENSTLLKVPLIICFRVIQKVILFESRLQVLKAPLTNQPSIFSEGQNLHQPRLVEALPIVQKYFELVGILEDG
jgi:hypothetical protein